MIDIEDLKKPTKDRINITIEPTVNKKLEEVAEMKSTSKSKIIWLALENYFQLLESK